MYYLDEITDLMRKHHQSLSEKDQRNTALPNLVCKEVNNFYKD
jgi:hypothetical protein